MVRRRVLSITAAVAAAAMGAGAVVLAALWTPELAPAALEAKYAGPASRLVEIAGVRAHIRDEGPRDAPVLVLVHGATLSLHTWEPWTARLRDTFRVVSVDMPGHGLTGPWPRDDYGLDANADFIAALVATLRLERFALAGHSLGGAAAWTYAARRPPGLTHLILVAGSAYPPDAPPSLRARVMRAPVVGEISAGLRDDAQMIEGYRGMFAGASKVDAAAARRYAELYRREGNRGAQLRRARTMPRLDPAPVRDVAVPTLLLWGADDRWVPLRDGERLRGDIPGSRLVVFPGVGHMPMVEAADATAAEVRAFVARK